MVSEIAKRRSISEKRVRDAIDQAWIPADTAKDLGLVDHLVDIDALRDLMASKIGKKVELLPGYGIEKERDVDFSNPFALLQLFTKKAEQPESPCVALVYVDGMIVEGEGSEGLFSASSAADGLIRRAMRIAQRDPNVKAIVIRIDSPGGSALASEAAWQAIRRVAKEKPVVVSIGAMAASGGYYIACAGDRIFADPSSIVGSIGVVGGKVSLNGLYQKLGLNAEMYSRGANAGMFSSSEPFTDSQRILVGRLMRQTYDQFVNRVMQTRKGRIADVDKVARGRIFAGIRAKELGLVDEIGGLNAALRDAAVKGALNPDKMEVRVLPAPRSLTDLLGEKEQVAAPLGMGSHMPLELSFLPATLRDLAAMQWSAMTQMSTGRVMLVPPAMMRLR
jgi:protease-4